MTEKTNVDQLEETAKILQDIKNGIGTNVNKTRMDAYFELHALNDVIGRLNISKKEHQLIFAVGEYYSFADLRKTEIFKVRSILSGKMKVESYRTNIDIFTEYETYITGHAIAVTHSKRAAVQQIAVFKLAEIKSVIGLITKNGDGDWIEIVEDIEEYLAE